MEDNQRLVALNHYFGEESNETLTFDRNKDSQALFQLSFSNELVGLRTKSQILSNTELENTRLESG